MSALPLMPGSIKQLERVVTEVAAARAAATVAEAKRREQEDRRREQEEAAKAQEVTRQEKQRERLQALGALSPEQIAKAEELMNWDYIKEKQSSLDLRDHLAQFPTGVSARMARERLEALVGVESGNR